MKDTPNRERQEHGAAAERGTLRQAESAHRSCEIARMAERLRKSQNAAEDLAYYHRLIAIGRAIKSRQDP
jgi:hypothetical protein